MLKKSFWDSKMSMPLAVAQAFLPVRSVWKDGATYTKNLQNLACGQNFLFFSNLLRFAFEEDFMKKNRFSGKRIF